MIQDYGDPFNWKFPQRNETMSLQSINQKDAGFQIYSVSKLRDTALNTKDIKGAQPQLKPYQFTKKETYVNRIDDIQGTQPNKLYQYTNKESYVLKNDDIKGCKTQVNSFVTKRQGTNPLEPVYQLPVVEHRVPTPPKFVRNAMDIDDIEGSRPNHKVFQPRKQDIYTEIPGSKPKEKFIPKHQIDSLNVQDINQYKRFISTRQTNPLNPGYKIPADKSTYNEYSLHVDVQNYGEIKGTQSKRLHPIEQYQNTFNLNTKDIHGAQADTYADNFLRKNDRKDFRKTNNTQDMPWANQGSLKKGIQTIRSLNPLRPDYQLPGEKEAEQERLEELRNTGVHPQTTKAYSQASNNNNDQENNNNGGRRSSQLSNVSNNKALGRSSSQAGLRRDSQQSQSSLQNKPAFAATQTQFRPPKPQYDTLGNKIKDRGLRTQGNNRVPLDLKEANMTKAQKLDKFIK